MLLNLFATSGFIFEDSINYRSIVSLICYFARTGIGCIDSYTTELVLLILNCFYGKFYFFGSTNGYYFIFEIV